MASPSTSRLADALPPLVAGFVTVLVSYAGTAAILFQACKALGASPAQTGSLMWAMGIGCGLTCIGLSLRWKMPVVTSWSTPGAAVLAISASGVPLDQAVGGFLLCALLLAVAGFSGAFERLFERVPLSLAAAMLGGVLLRFCVDAFAAIQLQPALVLAMLAAWLLARLRWPRYAVILSLATGTAVAAAGAQLHAGQLQLALAQPQSTSPGFGLASVFSVALPLFVVTMASQNVPGMAVGRACGYRLPASSAVGWTGLATLLLAPFGGFAFNLAAITAAISMGPDAHRDPDRRYLAAVWTGVFYLLAGVFGATVVALFSAFPHELVAAIAGIALLPTFANAMAGALAQEREREAAIVTFLVTASGLSVAGVGAAFWGLVAGIVVHFVRPRRG